MRGGRPQSGPDSAIKRTNLDASFGDRLVIRGVAAWRVRSSRGTTRSAHPERFGASRKRQAACVAQRFVQRFSATGAQISHRDLGRRGASTPTNRRSRPSQANCCFAWNAAVALEGASLPASGDCESGGYERARDTAGRPAHALPMQDATPGRLGRADLLVHRERPKWSGGASGCASTQQRVAASATARRASRWVATTAVVSTRLTAWWRRVQDDVGGAALRRCRISQPHRGRHWPRDPRRRVT